MTATYMASLCVLVPVSDPCAESWAHTPVCGPCVLDSVYPPCRLWQNMRMSSQSTSNPHSSSKTWPRRSGLVRWAQGRAYSLLAGWAGSGSWALGMVVTMRVSVRWREGKGGVE